MFLRTAGKRSYSNYFSTKIKQKRRKEFFKKVEEMKKEYDFEKMKGRKNPYAKKLKKSVTIRLDDNVIEYFKKLSDETDIPYQSLINLFLKDCALTKKRPLTKWKKVS